MQKNIFLLVVSLNTVLHAGGGCSKMSHNDVTQPVIYTARADSLAARPQTPPTPLTGRRQVGIHVNALRRLSQMSPFQTALIQTFKTRRLTGQAVPLNLTGIILTEADMEHLMTLLIDGVFHPREIVSNFYTFARKRHKSNPSAKFYRISWYDESGAEVVCEGDVPPADVTLSTMPMSIEAPAK